MRFVKNSELESLTSRAQRNEKLNSDLQAQIESVCEQNRSMETQLKNVELMNRRLIRVLLNITNKAAEK